MSSQRLYEDNCMKTMQEIFARWREFADRAVDASLEGVPLRLRVLSTPEEHREGFMGKPEPSSNEGLWFKYPEPRVLGFWMKNVPYDLDLVGLDDEHRVVQIIRLRANDEETKTFRVPCRHALELRAGTCSKNGIGLGSVLEVAK